jgi:alpha-N-arabinofuranosidase
MTKTGGGIWVQSIFYPFSYASNFGRGTALKQLVSCESYSTGKHDNIPFVESSVIYNAEKTELVLFAVNRSLKENIELSFEAKGFENITAIEHVVLQNDDMKASNSLDNPFNIEPFSSEDVTTDGDKATIPLQKHSWNMIRFSIKS